VAEVLPPRLVGTPVPRKIRSRLFLKYAGLFVAVVCVALVTNGLFEIWVSYREHRDALIQIQREQAESGVEELGKALEAASGDMGTITGQHPVITRAKTSISNFKLREGMPIGVMVTLRNDRMWEFLDRLLNAALPRIRDFNGVSPNSFDGRGNYSLGLREQMIFPEIEYDKIDKIRGMQITMVTTAKTDEEAKRLLELLGMPFARRGQ